jgi:hypothetical protein
MKLSILVSLQLLNRKIRQLCLLSTFCFLSFVSIGQNLVLNSGFDSIISCPPSGGTASATLNLAYHWYDPTGISSDLLNACHATFSSVPSNSVGYQLARSDSGYAGFISYWENIGSWSDGKEYLTGHLSESLIVSTKYYLEFYVSLADNSKYGTSLIGAYLSTDSMEYDGSLFLPLTPQVKNDTGNIIVDKINWTKISGCFQASGGESHLTIGNFNNDTITENYITQVVGSGFSAYYYVEDVQLHEIPAFKSDSNHFICAGIIDSTFLNLSDTSEVTTYSWFPTNGLTSPTSPQTWAKPTVTTIYTLSQYTPCDTSTIDVTVYVDCDSIVSVESLNFPLSNFKLFPNPNTGEFTFTYEITEPAQLVIQLQDK